MDVLKWTAVLVGAALLCAALRVQKPEMAMALSLAAGVLALLWAVDGIGRAMGSLSALATGAGLSADATALMLRASGIALVVDFGASLCRDAGESALAGRIELGGRVALLGMSLPLVTGLVERLRGLFA